MQSAHDDNETLEPHSGVHTHADEIDDENIAPAPAEPEELWRKALAKEHAHPPVPPIRPEHAVPESEALILIAAVPGYEKFREVGVGNDRARQQNDLRHLVDVLERDDVVQFERRARRQD